MLRGALVVAAGLLAAGCVTDPVQVAEADDAACQGYGYAPGSDRYANCRMLLDLQRKDAQAAASRRAATAAAAGLQQASDGYARAAAANASYASPVTCRSVNYGYGAVTRCF